MFGERLSYLPGGDRSRYPDVASAHGVVTAELVVLDEKVRHFDPHLVICSLPVTAGYRDIVCWVELSLESPTQPSVVCVDGRYSKHNNPTLEELLRILDEVEQLL